MTLHTKGSPRYGSHSELRSSSSYIFWRPDDVRKAWQQYTPPPPPHNLLSEVQTFRVYGELRRSTTLVKNTLPTSQVIADEKVAIEYDRTRRTNPHSINYNVYNEKMRETGKKIKAMQIKYS